MSRLTPKELAEAITDFVNSTNRDKHAEFVDCFSRQHRTLQQSSLGLFLKVIEHMASDDYDTDGRNEDSKKISKNIIEGFKAVKKAEYISEGVSEQRAHEYVENDRGSRPSNYLGFI